MKRFLTLICFMTVIFHLFRSHGFHGWADGAKDEERNVELKKALWMVFVGACVNFI